MPEHSGLTLHLSCRLQTGDGFLLGLRAAGSGSSCFSALAEKTARITVSIAYSLVSENATGCFICVLYLSKMIYKIQI